MSIQNAGFREPLNLPPGFKLLDNDSIQYRGASVILCNDNELEQYYTRFMEAGGTIHDLRLIREKISSQLVDKENKPDLQSIAKIRDKSADRVVAKMCAVQGENRLETQKELAGSYILQGGSFQILTEKLKGLKTEEVKEEVKDEVEGITLEVEDEENDLEVDAIIEAASNTVNRMKSFRKKAYIKELALGGDTAAIRAYIQNGGSRKALALAIEKELRVKMKDIKPIKEMNEHGIKVDVLNVNMGELKKEFADRLTDALQAKWDYFQAEDRPELPLRQRMGFRASSIFGTRNGNYCRELLVLLQTGEKSELAFFAQGGSLKSISKHAKQLQISTKPTRWQRFLGTGPRERDDETKKALTNVSDFLQSRPKSLKEVEKADQSKKIEAILADKDSQSVIRYIHSGGKLSDLSKKVNRLLSLEDKVDVKQPDLIAARKSGSVAGYNILRPDERQAFRIAYRDKLEVAIREGRKNSPIRSRIGAAKEDYNQAIGHLENIDEKLNFVEKLQEKEWTESEIYVVLQAVEGSRGFLNDIANVEKIEEKKVGIIELAEIIIDARPGLELTEHEDILNELLKTAKGEALEQNTVVEKAKTLRNNYQKYRAAIEGSAQEEFERIIEPAQAVLDTLTVDEVIDDVALLDISKTIQEQILEKQGDISDANIEFLILRSNELSEAQREQLYTIVKEKIMKLDLSTTFKKFDLAVTYLLEIGKDDDLEVFEKIYSLLRKMPKKDRFENLGPKIERYYAYRTKNGLTDQVDFSTILEDPHHRDILPHQRQKALFALKYELRLLNKGRISVRAKQLAEAKTIQDGSENIDEFVVASIYVMKLDGPIQLLKDKINELSDDDEFIDGVSSQKESLAELMIQKKQVIDSLWRPLKDLDGVLMGKGNYAKIKTQLLCISELTKENKVIPEVAVAHLNALIDDNKNLDWEKDLGISAEAVKKIVKSLADATQKSQELSVVQKEAESVIALRTSHAHDTAWAAVKELPSDSGENEVRQLEKLSNWMEYAEKTGLDKEFPVIVEELSVLKAELMEGKLNLEQFNLAMARLDFHEAYFGLAKTKRPSSMKEGASIEAHEAFRMLYRCNKDDLNTWSSLAKGLKEKSVPEGKTEKKQDITKDAIDDIIAHMPDMPDMYDAERLKGMKVDKKLQIALKIETDLVNAKEQLAHLVEGNDLIVFESRKVKSIGGLGRRENEDYEDPNAPVEMVPYDPLGSLEAVKLYQYGAGGRRPIPVPLRILERTVTGSEAYHNQDSTVPGISPFATVDKLREASLPSKQQSFVYVRRSGGKTPSEGINRAFKEVYTEKHRTPGKKTSKRLQPADTYVTGQFQDWVDGLPERFAKEEFKINDPKLLSKLKKDFEKQIEKKPKVKQKFTREMFASYVGNHVTGGTGGKKILEFEANYKVFEKLVKDYESGEWKEGETRTLSIPLFIKELDDSGNVVDGSEDPRERVMAGIETVFSSVGFLDAITDLDPRLEAAHDALGSKDFNLLHYIAGGGSVSMLINAAEREVELLADALNLESPIPSPNLVQVRHLINIIENFNNVNVNSADDNKLLELLVFTGQLTVSDLDNIEKSPIIKKGAYLLGIINKEESELAISGSALDVVEYFEGSMPVFDAANANFEEDEIKSATVSLAQLTEAFGKIQNELFKDSNLTAKDLSRAQLLSKNLEMAVHIAMSHGVPDDCKEVNVAKEMIEGLKPMILEAKLSLLGPEITARKEQDKAAGIKITNEKSASMQFKPSDHIIRFIREEEATPTQILTTLKNLEGHMLPPDKSSSWAAEIDSLHDIARKALRTFGEESEGLEEISEYMEELQELKQLFDQISEGSTVNQKLKHAVPEEKRVQRLEDNLDAINGNTEILKNFTNLWKDSDGNKEERLVKYFIALSAEAGFICAASRQGFNSVSGLDLHAKEAKEIMDDPEQSLNQLIQWGIASVNFLEAVNTEGIEDPEMKKNIERSLVDGREELIENVLSNTAKHFFEIDAVNQKDCYNDLSPKAQSLLRKQLIAHDKVSAVDFLEIVEFLPLKLDGDLGELYNALLSNDRSLSDYSAELISALIDKDTSKVFEELLKVFVELDEGAQRGFYGLLPSDHIIRFIGEEGATPTQILTTLKDLEEYMLPPDRRSSWAAEIDSLHDIARKAFRRFDEESEGFGELSDYMDELQSYKQLFDEISEGSSVNQKLKQTVPEEKRVQRLEDNLSTINANTKILKNLTAECDNENVSDRDVKYMIAFEAEAVFICAASRQGFNSVSGLDLHAKEAKEIMDDPEQSLNQLIQWGIASVNFLEEVNIIGFPVDKRKNLIEDILSNTAKYFFEIDDDNQKKCYNDLSSKAQSILCKHLIAHNKVSAVDFLDSIEAFPTDNDGDLFDLFEMFTQDGSEISDYSDKLIVALIDKDISTALTLLQEEKPDIVTAFLEDEEADTLEDYLASAH